MAGEDISLKVATLIQKLFALHTKATKICQDSETSLPGKERYIQMLEICQELASLTLFLPPPDGNPHLLRSFLLKNNQLHFKVLPY